jgi:hypothetical protein
VLIWNNTVLGKYHPPFNLYGYTSVSSDHYMDANNAFASKEVVFDVSNFNGSATNRWAELFGVGCFNNSSTQIGLSPGTLVGQNNAGNELGFDGISSYFNVTTNSAAFLFVTNASWCGGNSNGLGDYHLRSTSPIVSQSLVGTSLLPFDIEGKPRAVTDPPGAYATVISNLPSVIAIGGPAAGTGSELFASGSPQAETKRISILAHAQFAEASAGASSTPRITGIMMMAEGRVRLVARGTSGQRCNVLASEDLTTWRVLGEALVSADGSVEFNDTQAMSASSRYYRLAAP